MLAILEEQGYDRFVYPRLNQVEAFQIVRGAQLLRNERKRAERKANKGASHKKGKW